MSPLTDDEIRAHTIGELLPHAAPILLVDSDSVWPALFEQEAARIRLALGDRALVIEHDGSTSVPGLAAKPCIDILLVVPDSADEPAYVPARPRVTCCASASRTGTSTASSRGRTRSQPARLLAGLPGDRAHARLPGLAAQPPR